MVPESSRIDAICAIKSRYLHILKVLTKIGLSSKDSKERTRVVSIKKDNVDLFICPTIGVMGKGSHRFTKSFKGASEC